MDSRDFDKEEYVSLRNESQFHQVNASAVFALYVTGLGIGVAASSKAPVALPLVAILSSVLWLRYLDHLIAIFRVAAYVTCWLRPRLCDHLQDAKLLVWEEFLRSADPVREPEGGASPDSRLPPLSRKTGLPTLPKDSRRGVDVAAVAFFLPPPVLILVYAYRLYPFVLPTDTRALVQFVGLLLLGGLGVVFWIHATRRAWRTRAQIDRIDTKIKDTLAGSPVLSAWQGSGADSPRSSGERIRRRMSSGEGRANTGT